MTAVVKTDAPTPRRGAYRPLRKNFETRATGNVRPAFAELPLPAFFTFFPTFPPPDNLPPPTFPPSLPPDSFPPPIFPPLILPPAESLPPETFPPEIFPPESIV